MSRRRENLLDRRARGRRGVGREAEGLANRRREVGEAVTTRALHEAARGDGAAGRDEPHRDPPARGLRDRGSRQSGHDRR